jgi:putative transposase
MSRLRRLYLAGKVFFVTCNVSRTQAELADSEFAILAQVFNSVRKRRKFLLAGYVFMPDHWHAVIAPSPVDTLPRLMGALKVASTQAINRRRGKRGNLWQFRYFDHTLRTVKEFHDALRYMHLNPVRKGLVEEPEDWAWSSFKAFNRLAPVRLAIDNLNLPADETTPL